ncbi:MAG: tRNA glutamyl-Q(34) synthetase GluQRS [Steroidobacteraceae bacterium]
MQRSLSYRGRFAPSPTGPLHFGSLVAAVGSYLQARQARGQWLVRIEDLDPPRTVPGSADLILRTLEGFGFVWDEAVVFQSTRAAAYEQALQTLIAKDLSYPCSCTRSELQALANNVSGTSEELHYPGRCRHGPLRTETPYAWRFRTPAEPICFHDRLQGEHCINLQDSIGDFVIKRRDGWFAYQLAVVVDDAAQHISEVVRGADLLLNTPRQIALQRALDLETPSYLHLPIAADRLGNKLAKSTAAAPVEIAHAAQTLWSALYFLRQAPPDELQTASLNTLWQWAIAHWNAGHLRNLRQLEYRT